MNVQNGRRIVKILAAVFVFGTCPARAEDSSYILALSWQPAFCASDAGAARPECRMLDDQDWSASHFSLHGLWPNGDRNGDGRMDEADDYCLPPESRARLIADDRGDWRRLPPVSLPGDVMQRLMHVMPGTASGLERHQWIKHGSCSGLDAAQYFTAATALSETVAKAAFSKFVAARIGSEVTRREILQAFSGEFGRGSDRALQMLCAKRDGSTVLSEIRLRLKADAVAQDLTSRSLETGKASKGNCPARFRVERAG